jgi:hypothetical protein
VHCELAQEHRGEPHTHLGEEHPILVAVELASGSKAGLWWLGPHPVPQEAQGTYVIVLPVSTITANFLGGLPRNMAA